MTFCIHNYVYADFNHRVCQNCGQAEFYNPQDMLWHIVYKPTVCEEKKP
jgi:hypothetical protein